jgi:integrase
MSIEKHPTRAGSYYVKSYPNGRKGKVQRDLVDSWDKAVALDDALKSKNVGANKIVFPKIADVVDEYLAWACGNGDGKKRKLSPDTYASRERRLNRYIIPHFGKYRVKDLNQRIFDEYEKTVAHWTFQTDLYSLLAIIRWMVKREYAEQLTWSPERPKGEHAVKPVPHPADMIKAIESIPKEQHRVLFKLMLYTGLRWNEAKNLKWQDVDLKSWTIRIKEVDNAAQDILYIPEPLRGWMEDNQKESGLIWEGRKPGKPYNTLEKVLTAAGKSVGIHITSHTFRHASGTYLYENTNDLYAVQAHLRHKKITTTQIYARMSVNRRKTSVASVIDYVDNNL